MLFGYTTNDPCKGVLVMAQLHTVFGEAANDAPEKQGE